MHRLDTTVKLKPVGGGKTPGRLPVNTGVTQRVDTRNATRPCLSCGQTLNVAVGDKADRIPEAFWILFVIFGAM